MNETRIFASKDMSCDCIRIMASKPGFTAKEIEWVKRDQGERHNTLIAFSLGDDVLPLVRLMTDLWECGIRPMCDVTPESQIVKAKDAEIAHLKWMLETLMPSALRGVVK